MAAIGGKYDPNEEPSTGREVMPIHETVAQVVESDCRKTKAGTGEYIYLKWEILEGTYKGRWLFENYNIVNPSAKAQQIGNGQFAAVRKACFGTKDKTVADTQELHGIPCKIKVGCRKRDDGTMENHITNIKGVNEASAPAAGSTGEKKPW